jgi:hypothetical protein
VDFHQVAGAVDFQVEVQVDSAQAVDLLVAAVQVPVGKGQFTGAWKEAFSWYNCL